MIAILLATYNGGRYLKEQIDSIIGQSYNDWILYITDDGSTDNTIDIIESYTCSRNNIVFLPSSKGMGAKNSFMWLLNEVDADYYMFADQDDIWLPDKILKTYQKMLDCQARFIDKNCAIIIHSDLLVVDENLNIISNSFAKYTKTLIQYSSFSYYSAYNNITGCTMMFNRKSRELSLNPPPFIKMHDSWIARVVSFNQGVIEYIDTPLIMYRQHSNNVLGAKKSVFVLKKIFMLKRIVLSNICLFKEISFISGIGAWDFIMNKLNYFIKSCKHD